MLALRVAGVTPGFYHYSPRTSSLHLVRKGATSKQAVEYLAGQSWYAGAAAVVFMTAVLPRVWWRCTTTRERIEPPCSKPGTSARPSVLWRPGWAWRRSARWRSRIPASSGICGWTASARSSRTPPAWARGPGTGAGSNGRGTRRRSARPPDAEGRINGSINPLCEPHSGPGAPRARPPERSERGTGPRARLRQGFGEVSPKLACRSCERRRKRRRRGVRGAKPL